MNPTIPSRVQEINNRIAAQGNKDFSVAPSAMKSPTVLSDSEIRDTTIPSIINKANEITNAKTPILDQNGNTLAIWNSNLYNPETKQNGAYRDISTGSLYKPQDTSEIGIESSVGDYASIKKALGIEDTTQENDPQIQVLKQMQASSDASFNEQINATQASYQQLQNSMRELQNFSTGQFRGAIGAMGGKYTPYRSIGIMQNKLAGDITELAGLTSQENMDIAKLRSAQQDKDFQLMGKQLEIIESRRKEKLDLADKIYSQIQEQQKLIKQEKQKIIDNINTVATDARKNGADDATIDLIINSKSVGEAIKNAGGYLQGGTGIIGEYNYYKKDALARGLVPLSFDEYQTRDANRKVSIAKAGTPTFTTDENGNVIETGNYDALTIGRYNRAVNAATTILQKNPTFKNIIGASAYLDRIEAAIKNPGSVGDQELLDAFTQLNTGGNRVTEAQVHLVTSTGSLSDLMNRWSNKLKTGGALSADQRNQIVTLSREVYENYQKSYRPLYNDVTKKLQSQGIPKQFWNLPDPDTLSRSASESGINGDIIEEQQANEDKVIASINSIKTTNPSVYKAASTMMISVNELTGQPYTPEEILQAFPELK